MRLYDAVHDNRTPQDAERLLPYAALYREEHAKLGIDSETIRIR